MKHVLAALNKVVRLGYSNRHLNSRVYENGEFWTAIQLLPLLPHRFLNLQVLDMFAKFQKATISCVMFLSACLSVRR